ncbi:hypothetical protein Tco_0516962 [Tanacetum coccineum]
MFFNEKSFLDNDVVESDGAVECDEVILVSDSSEALNSSLVKGETGVGSGKVRVWSDDGGVVLVAEAPLSLREPPLAQTQYL